MICYRLFVKGFPGCRPTPLHQNASSVTPQDIMRYNETHHPLQQHIIRYTETHRPLQGGGWWVVGAGWWVVGGGWWWWVVGGGWWVVRGGCWWWLW